MNSVYIFLLFFSSKLVFADDEATCEIAQTCITDLGQEECGAAMILVPNTSIFGCCPSCQLPTPTGEDEEDNLFDESCKPPATCLEDGRFAPVQCKGDMFKGRCFCSDENGNRIFGQMWRNEANDMTCACSRRRAELEKDKGQSVYLHCLPNGDYESLQCNDGLCWCADQKTGQPTVIPVPEADMKILPCYETRDVGEQYLRRCESIFYGFETIYREQAEHGTNFFGNSLTPCDYDGTYGGVHVQNGISRCTDREGKHMGSWQAPVTNITVNCNCARDTMIHFPERGITMLAECFANGNYRPNQMAGNVVYCVDSDGYTIEREFWPPECTNAIIET